MPHLKTTEFMNWIRTKVCSSVHVWSDLKQLYFHHKFLIFHVWNCIPKNTFFFHLQLKIEKFFLLSICLLKQTPSLFVQFSSVTQLYPTFCNPMNHSTPGLPVYHQLPEFTQTHVHQVGHSWHPFCHLIFHCPLLLLPPIPPSIRVFSNESTLRMRSPKYWSFSFSISPS